MACHPCPDDAPQVNRRGDALPGHADPATETEAEDRIRQLTFDIQSVEMQLGDTTRRDRLRDKYAQWRIDATVALQSKRDQKRQLVLWLKRHRRARQEEGARARRLVGELYDLLMATDGKLKGEAAVEEAEEYLEGR